jgi:glucokinase
VRKFPPKNQTTKITMEKFSIGVDLGGTSIKFATVTASGKIISEHHLPTEAKKGQAVVIGNLMKGIEQLLSANTDADNAKNLVGVGIGVPGVVSLDGGTISYPPNLPGWTVVRLGDIIAEKLRETRKLRVKIAVENDANIAALGEAKFGAGRELKNFMMITLGTGVGGGIILNDKIYRGVSGGAGEVGQVSINYGGEPSNAGIRGTIESYIGQQRISEYAREIVKENPHSKILQLAGGKPEAIEPKIIADACKHGDQTAIQIFNHVGTLLGCVLGTAVSILDIRKFVIGGGVAGAGDYIFKPAAESLKHFTLKSMHDGLEILPAKLGNKAGVMGAAALAMEK